MITQEEYNEILYKEVQTDSVLDMGSARIEKVFDSIVKVQQSEVDRKKKMIQGQLTNDADFAASITNMGQIVDAFLSYRIKSYSNQPSWPNVDKDKLEKEE